LRALEHKIANSLAGFSAAGVTLHMTDEGLVISLAAARFFRSGDAAINPKQIPILAAIVRQIDGLRNLMRVEGFTDSIPIHTVRYADNWDLSAQRAGNVLRYLLANSTLDARNLSLAGYGPYRPVASNANETGRALNRRVDIVIRPLGWKD
ncbi:MAG: OmpA/MotB family protein, partial [Candidatus Binataceae bacterium]